MKEKKKLPFETGEADMRISSERIDTDKMGSYTGITENPWDEPVQDADDL